MVHPTELVDPWQAAGVLLHEALHLKLFDAARCFGLIDEPKQVTPIPQRVVAGKLPGPVGPYDSCKAQPRAGSCGLR